MPCAYSYLRFSSPKQAEGDSIRRQTADRQRWLDAHPGVPLDTSLVLEDKGRSAFKRVNWDTYALARFVECVKSGRVEPGSYLLVENLDRLSREDAGEGTELFLSIVNKGIVIVQLSPEVTEFRKPVDMMNLMRAVLELSRGHSESAMKSDRCRKAWARKNAEAASRVVTNKLPGWIRRGGNGQLELDPSGAATVRRMFALARGGMSVLSIAKAFNSEGVPVLGRKTMKGRAVMWAAPTIYQMIASRATLGEYTPYQWTRRADKPTAEPIKGYYPAVVDEDTYHAARAAIATRAQVGRGRRGTHINLFAGLLRDARTGGSISYHHHAGRSELVPVGATHGKTAKWSSFTASVFEDAVVKKLIEVQASDVIGDGRDETRKVESVSGQLSDAERKVKWYQAQCDGAEKEGDFQAFAGKVIEWERKRKSLATELSSAQQRASSPLSESWGEFRSLAELLRNDPSDELRLKVRAALRRSIESITCLFVGTRVRAAAVRVQFREGGAHRDYVIFYAPGRSNQTVKRPGTWAVLSFAEAELSEGDLDLRKPNDAAAVEQFLMGVDAKSLLEKPEPAEVKKGVKAKPVKVEKAAKGKAVKKGAKGMKK